MTAQEVIEKFDLKPLPNEGGFFKQIYLDPHKIPTTTLGPFAKEHLPLFSVIYYLITPDSFSALHKLVGSEVWTWVAGGVVRASYCPSVGNMGKAVSRFWQEPRTNLNNFTRMLARDQVTRRGFCLVLCNYESSL